MTQPARMTGVLSPVVTPFKKDLSPDAERWIRHCKWLVSQNVGLAVFGTNSEANSLSVEERIELLDRLGASGIDPKMMMPGTGCCAIPDSVRLTKAALKLGVGGVLMLPPFYYKGVSDDGLFAAFSEVIERVGDARLKVYLYHIPPVANVPISLKLIARLIKAYPGTVAGIKDSSGDWSNTEAMLKEFPGWGIFAGNELILLDTLKLGGAGCISATANINPGPIHQLFANWQSAEAPKMQEKLNDLRLAVQKFPVIPALKQTIADHLDDPAWPTVRPPLTGLTQEQIAGLRAALKTRGFTMPGLREIALQPAE
jgi:4-hydroxy-tetrahydrodipicolinate synthase